MLPMSLDVTTLGGRDEPRQAEMSGYESQSSGPLGLRWCLKRVTQSLFRSHRLKGLQSVVSVPKPSLYAL
jgi:hypothetical protein